MTEYEGEHSVVLWEIQFAVKDSEGRFLLDEDGNVRKFYVPNGDFNEYMEGLTDAMEIHWLREIPKLQYGDDEDIVAVVEDFS
jgi:hypothetical protein